jgi:nucleotidyltransferase substrate binding protein (TIGR01987 family)
VKLDATALVNAVRRLREGLARCEREPADEQLRDGLIQRFEFTYELSHKMLRRYLRETAATPDEVEQLPFADLIRSGSAQGLLRRDWLAWRRFREMRGRTSHVYDGNAAMAVVAAIPEFLKEVEYLSNELRRRLA